MVDRELAYLCYRMINLAEPPHCIPPVLRSLTYFWIEIACKGSFLEERRLQRGVIFEGL